MKKMICLLCGILVVISSFSVVSAVSECEYEFEIINGEVVITGYNGSDTEIIIPERIENHIVTSIGDNAFISKGLTSVKLPGTIKK